MDHFNGVLNGRNVNFRGTDTSQRGVQGRRLATPGGSAHQHDTVGHTDKLVVTDQVRGGKPQLIEVLEQNIRVHDPHDHLFSESRGDHGYTYFDFHTLFFSLDPAILGPPLFSHVDSRQVLDPADDSRVNFFRYLVDCVQDTIDTHPDHAGISFRFNMNIAGPLIKCIGKEMAHGIDNM